MRESINGSKSPVSSPVKRNQRSCSGIGSESRFYDTGSVSERGRAEYRRADFIVTYEEPGKGSRFMQRVKVVFVSVLSFFGAAFSIMAFNNDVDAPKLFDQIYTQIMGNKPDGFTILELTYSLGLAVGILIFFNHFGKKKFTVDPTPMEVEMRLYENDIQTTLIETYSRKERELHVDQTDSSCSHRK